MSDTFASIFGARAFEPDTPISGGRMLFGEDFDRPPPPPPPKPESAPAEPTFSAADLAAAREAGHAAGREAARAEFENSAKAAAARALEDIAARIAAAADEATAAAEETATAVAKLLLACFATSFPALSSRHGAVEAAAVVRDILPALQREPNISIRVNPHILAEMTKEIQALDPDLAAKIRLIPTDAMTEGDVRIAWEHGTAVRDATSLWRQIEDVLAPMGLLTNEKTAAQRTGREHAHVQ